MRDEEVAAKIVGLYFEDVARIGFKRQLDLDQVINAYFYTLRQLGEKESKMRSFEKKILSEEKEMLDIPSVTTTTVEENPTRRRTVTTETTTKPKQKSVTEILEEN